MGLLTQSALYFTTLIRILTIKLALLTQIATPIKTSHLLNSRTSMMIVQPGEIT